MPQPLTKAGIANLALAFLGQKPIPATDTAWTTTTEAIKVKAVWDNARLIALRDQAWKFARRRIELTAVTGVGADTYHGFDYVWAFPANTHIIRKVYIDTTAPNPDPIEFAQFNGASGSVRLATNLRDDDDKCYAETTYTAEVTDDAQYLTYDPYFVTAFALQIAYLVAMPLTKDKNLENSMVEKYNAAINKAKTIDANEERILSTRKGESTFLSSRG